MHHAKAIIEQEYLNPPSLHRLALRVGTNECTLKGGFKTVFGTTVFGHIFDYRMEMACRYLLDSSKTIQEIGACVGYEYHAHFSTAFKRKFGLTVLTLHCNRLHIQVSRYECQTDTVILANTLFRFDRQNK